MHAETLREFSGGEQALGAEPIGVAGRWYLRQMCTTMPVVKGLFSSAR